MPSRAGSPNKPKRRLIARLEQDFPAYHPVAALAEMLYCKCGEGGGKVHRVGSAGCVEEKLPLELQVKIHSAIAEYVEPKLSRSEQKIEHSGSIRRGEAAVQRAGEWLAGLGLEGAGNGDRSAAEDGTQRPLFSDSPRPPSARH